jgi:PAS domain S-box-containing protein
MRNNLPVTNNEYLLHDDTMIVSKTDIKGRLTFFNDQFVTISGFTEGELMGKPHNIVRHPDMPPEAFEDLWTTLEAGKPWAGAVKNRRKNGDFYWVMASATPIWENGKVTGYMSIRTKLAQDQREEAEKVYGLIREKQAGAYRVDAGLIRRRKWTDRLSWFAGTLKARLTTMVAIQAAFIAVVGLIGVLAVRDTNARLKTIYEDRTVPLAQLSEINERMKDNTVALFEAAVFARTGKSSDATVARINSNIDAISRVWSEYMATYLTPEEKITADDFTIRRAEYVDSAIRPGLKLLADRNYDALDLLLTGKASDLLARAKADMDKLTAIQVNVAKDEFEISQARYGWVIGAVVSILISALLLGGYLGLRAIRAISAPLGRLNAAMAEIQQGRFNSRIIIDSDDELGSALRDVQAMQSKLGFDREEQRSRHKMAEEEKRKALKEMAATVERETNVAVGEVAGQTERMAGNASLMNDSAAMLGANSSSVAAAAEEALANAQTLAQAASQMSSSISQITAQVNSSRALTMEAVAASTLAQETIGKLDQAATRVGAVTSLISEIAAQTNLLALNATIEAARAGDVGRGFAVVASEVKSLAEQTAKATSEISQQIAEMQEATRASVASITTIGDVIKNIDAYSSSIAQSMETQNLMTVEISKTVEESAHAAREVATQIVTVSTEAGETGRRATEIRDGSADIAGKVAGLRSMLVQVVRTSTADVDRRMNVRIELDRPGTLEFAGSSVKVRVCNLSEGGALLDYAAPDNRIDASVTLLIDGVAARLNGVVTRVEDGQTLIAFRLTEAAERIVQALVSSRMAA